MSKPLCFSCGHILDKKFKDYGYVENTFETFFPKLEIFYCGSCGIGQVDHARIDPVKLGEYYRNVFRSIPRFNEANNGEEYRKSYFTARAKGQIHLAKKYLLNEAQNILEFGGGLGYSLAEIKSEFPGAKLYINEIDEGVKLPAYVLKDKAEIKFDIIFMSHVLEHLHVPQETMRGLIGRLKENGLLIIEVPNQKEEVIKESKSMEPHITFFSLKSLERFFSTHFSHQLKILQVTTSGSRQVLGKDGRGQNVRGCLKTILKRNAYPLFKILKSVYHSVRRPSSPCEATPQFNFCNDTEEDLYNDLRIVLRKIK